MAHLLTRHLPVLPSFSSRLSSLVSSLQHTSRLLAVPQLSAASWAMGNWGMDLRVPLKLEGGGVEVVQVIVSQYTAAPGPVYVQTTYDPQATPESADYRSLSLSLTLNCAELPLSAISALIKLDPDDLTPSERLSLETQISQKLTEITQSPVTATKDIPLLDYAKAVGTWTVVSNLCGLTVNSSPKTAVFEWFSPRQSFTMSLFHSHGNVTPIGALDATTGGTVNHSGLDCSLLSHHFYTHSTVKGFDGGTSFSKGFPPLSPDIVISERPTPSLFPTASLLIETETCCVDRSQPVVTATIVPAVVSNVGEAVAAFAYCSTLTRKIPKSLYRQWTTWLGTKQIESLEAVSKTHRNNSAMKDRLKTAVENVAVATAFRIAWRQKKTGETIHEASLAKAVEYAQGKVVSKSD